MIKSELVQKFCNMYPNLLRKDVEKILEIVFSEIIKLKISYGYQKCN